jgi:LmbE family N-acetylglucosaminyl deacetylase
MIAVILIGLIAAAAGAALIRRRRYRSIFRIKADRDDHFVWRCARLDLHVSVDARGIQLPATACGPGRSVFLKLKLTASTAGRLVDPWIEMQSASSRQRQYFERGVMGVRYLNLSPVLQQSQGGADLRITLTGHHLRWEREASLIVFDSPQLATGETLIVAPHPDDSEIAAFGLYSQRPSWIVTITCGERSPTDLSAAMSGDAIQRGRWLAKLRVWDSLNIPQLGGVPRAQCFNLVFPDAQLKQMHADPAQTFQIGFESGQMRQALRSANADADFQSGAARFCWQDLIGDLRRIIARARPEVIVCPHPLIDPHYDHVFSSVALAEALAASEHQPRLILLYAVHANEAPVFPYGPADSIVSLPPWALDQWIADSAWSLPLAEETRGAKFFAVEAAHDTRTYSPSHLRTMRQLAATFRREIFSYVAGTGPAPTDFLRRAPRPNEIYYVISVQGFRELAHRATQHR